MSRAKKPTPRWRNTPEGHASYQAARAEAQRRANEIGMDYGIEANDVFKSWHVFMLPGAQYRRGFELRCEVVMPEKLDACLPGHGPTAKPVGSGWIGGGL